MEGRSLPQALSSSYAPRLRTYNNSLLTPVLQSTAPGPVARTTKRGTTVINYAEDGYDYDDDDDDDNRRRPSGLRNPRREDSASRPDAGDKVGKDTHAPVHLQGIWRDWMTKARNTADISAQAQAAMPVTLIPIRIDVDVPAFVPAAAHPLSRGLVQAPPHAAADPALYRPGELTVPYKLRDVFLWNLHETVITTDQFALGLVQDLDLPNQNAIAGEISKQIRTQLEDYAGVALHPLFDVGEPTPAVTTTAAAFTTAAAASQAPPTLPPPPPQSTNRDSPVTPVTPLPPQSSRGPDTPTRSALDTPSKAIPSLLPEVTARATPIPADSDEYNPDDTYRCIVSLEVNLASEIYTDRFEWSLLHPPGTAEAFAKVTCADLGLSGEWVLALTHAIYEAVLRLKKGACEAGGFVAGWDAMGSEQTDAVHLTDAGWRYDPERLAAEWQPEIRTISKEEIERRQGDRERQMRRLRRETHRILPFGLGVEAEEERMGRGERSKKKRRFRSVSPFGRSGTPGGGGTPDVGYGGGVGTLTDQERFNWRCTHCCIWGTSVWAIRDGPYGPRSLCANCGQSYEKYNKLPRWTKNLHVNDLPVRPI
ncbi:hypothetical protein F5X97DRAFT_202996 [Nemania serpens]|nr:hypothetical protein F5X97DRAFT_202996 [Nemania serpens]